MCVRTRGQEFVPLRLHNRKRAPLALELGSMEWEDGMAQALGGGMAQALDGGMARVPDGK